MGWIWVAGAALSPGWVVWRTSPSETGWAPMPPAQDLATLSAASFDNASYWTFMDVATFDQGCSAAKVAPAAQVQSLMQSSNLVGQVRFVSGIEATVLPTFIPRPSSTV